MNAFKVECKELHIPSLDEICKVFSEMMPSNFKDVMVEVVDCPDLTKAPWSSCSPGLSGSSRLGEIGGVPYLTPIAKKEKLYDFNEVARLCNISDAYIIGAGAGPFPVVGCNSELILDLKTGSRSINNSIVALMESSEKHTLRKLSEHEMQCAILCNFYASKGLPGKVLHVKAKTRTGTLDFVECMRKALYEKYKNKVVGLGGIFRLIKGSAKIHIMPDFSDTPLNNDTDVDNWLKFFEFSAPMVFMSVFISKDPDLNIRLCHSHGYGSKYGGHYHYDTTPEEVEYEGYFNIAHSAYRIDEPANY